MEKKKSRESIEKQKNIENKQKNVFKKQNKNKTWENQKKKSQRLLAGPPLSSRLPQNCFFFFPVIFRLFLIMCFFQHDSNIC